MKTHISMRKNDAFTLVELLVVVAIMGLLSTIIIINTQRSKTTAQNNVIITNLNTLRSTIELWNNNNGSYLGFCVNDTCSSGSNDWKILCSAIKSQNRNRAVTCNINTQGTALCASTQFVDTSDYYCVDTVSSGKRGAAGCGTGTVCP